jgi:hypothetical protein
MWSSAASLKTGQPSNPMFFRTVAEAQAAFRCHWAEVEAGVWRFWNDPVSGIVLELRQGAVAVRVRGRDDLQTAEGRDVVERRLAEFRCHWAEVEAGVWRFWNDPVSGIGPSAYVIVTPEEAETTFRPPRAAMWSSAASLKTGQPSNPMLPSGVTIT